MSLDKVICASCMVPSEQYSVIGGTAYCTYCIDNNLYSSTYCSACGIVPIASVDERYCDGCASEVVEYLAEQYGESLATEKGWY